MPNLPSRTTPGDAMRVHGSVLPEEGRGVRACRMTCLLALLLACAAGPMPVQAMPSPPPASPAVSLEYAVKATYLYKLAPFVNWPAQEFATPDAPFRICVVGDDPFGDFLENAVAGRRFGNHPFEVRRLDTLTPDANCQIAFLGHVPSQGVAQALEAVKGRSVLTVLDSNVPDRGGIIQFVIAQGRVRFEIDTAAAARNHLTISSKLLNLALVVRPPP
ncbi:YfiR family protein [Rhodanobacter caeni]|uniref:YfiR family protein n=1 Tax=Rhodanobacter caeni TaxID=657654 RepID=A0ABN0U6M9_9GAMM